MKKIIFENRLAWQIIIITNVNLFIGTKRVDVDISFLEIGAAFWPPRRTLLASFLSENLEN
jgi:hypothetical protein